MNGSLVAQRSLTGATASTTYLHTDALGSPTAESTGAGALAKRTHYKPYGEPANDRYVSGVGFTGHATDARTGLTYMQARYYDPMAGRFLSTDPAEVDVGGAANFNRHAYAASNPYRFVDPDGREECNEACRRMRELSDNQNDVGSLEGFAWTAWDTLMPGAANWSYAEQYASQGNYAMAGAHGVSAISEAFLTVATLGAYQSLSTTARAGASAARGAASLPTKPGQLGHIFRNAPGHLADTPANRQLLTDVASNSANRVGADRFGNVWSSMTRPDGTQVWVSTRNGVIQNGGLNQVPQAFPNIVRP